MKSLKLASLIRCLFYCVFATYPLDWTSLVHFSQAKKRFLEIVCGVTGYRSNTWGSVPRNRPLAPCCAETQRPWLSSFVLRASRGGLTGPSWLLRGAHGNRLHRHERSGAVFRRAGGISRREN